MNKAADYYHTTIKNTIHELFEAGQKKNFEENKLLHYHGNAFTKFSRGPLYQRLSLEETLLEEQTFFSKISDYNFDIEDLKIDFFCNGNIAIATFVLHESGKKEAIVVAEEEGGQATTSLPGHSSRNRHSDFGDNHNLTLNEHLRATMIFLKLENSDTNTRNYFNSDINNNCKSNATTSYWKVVHEHFSRYPA